MLRYLRENTGNWIIKFFLFIIVIVFVFLGVGSMNATKQNEVASVNDEVITIKAFQEAYQNMVQNMRRQFGNALNDDLLKALNIRQQAVNSLIDEKLLELEAQKLKIVISDQEVKDALLAVKAFQRDGSFNLALYKKVLGLNGLTPETYEALMRRTLRDNKLKEMVLNSITVSDAEARTFFTFQNTKTAIDYIEINPEDLTDVRPGADEVEKQYKENPDLYKSEPKRKVAYLVFSPKDYAGKLGITEEQVKAYYNENIEQYKIPEKVEASHILIRLEPDADEAAVEAARKEAMAVYEKAARGEAFEELAKEFSQGPSAPNGGYLGVFEKKSMVKPFGDAAFAMKAGEISKPVKTQFGWHVIKVTRHMDAKTETLAEVSDRIRGEMEQDELNNQAYYKAGEAFDAVMDGDDFDQVALIAKKEIKTTPEFTATGEGLVMENAPAFAKAAFSIQKGDISDVKQLGDNYYIIRVTETIDPKPLSLDMVKEDIIVTLTARLQKAAAGQRADALLKKAETAGSVKALAEAENLEVKSSDLFTRTQTVQGINWSRPIVDAAFTLDKTQVLYPEVVEAGNRFYLIGFKERLTPEEDQIKEGMAATKEALMSQKQQQHLGAWMNELRAKADIQVNTEIIN